METDLRRSVPARWRHAVLVCGKCDKRAGGKSLAKALRARLGVGKGRKAEVGVVATKCLGLCPKRGVVVIDSRRPGEWLIVRGEDLDALEERIQI